MIDGRTGERWRMLLFLAPVLLGLVAMHALVAPAEHPSAPPAGAPAVVHTGHAGPQAPASGGDAAAPVPDRGHEGAAHLLHLCLAVLAAIGLLLLAALVLLGRVPLPAAVARTPGAARGPAVERPPPVARRLALLCVLRN